MSVGGWPHRLDSWSAMLDSIIAPMFFSVGLAHFIVLFVMLSQRLPVSEKWEKQY